jgi:glycosyltransferase involved in cell wall biosynthesis/GT2 family glycosyltransferase
MQPIDPPTGGGRLRLLGLYHGLGAEMRTHYVGTYDWPGPGFRRQMLSATLEETLVPLSAAHFEAAKAQSEAAGGRTVIDSAFHELAYLSPDYISAARKAAVAADIVIFSHPWIYPLVKDVLDLSRQLIVYDSHNVESLLRMELLDDGAVGTDVVRGVVAVEYELCHTAHLIFACSHEDRMGFVRLYGVPADRVRIVPNGTFAGRLTPASEDQKQLLRQKLGLGDAPAAVFIGSNYGPNVDAAQFIANSLSAALPKVNFIIAGGVGDSLQKVSKPPNLRITGSLPDDEKHDWLRAADLAINPMFGGSGTNIKMFDFMAAGLPIVSTPIGARGIDAGHGYLAVADGRSFADTISSLLADPARARALGNAARDRVEKCYSWERISSELGIQLARRRASAGNPRPFFSVVVPTFDRPASLTRLVERIAQQSYRNFELIVVDQSPERWPDRDRDFGIDMLYVHTDLRGAVYARNRGGDLASGQVLAFIDDDCEPSAGWLKAAYDEFSARAIVGLEGLVTSNRVNDAEWRAVTNEGFEGIGFMTANLFIQSDIFHSINGFDVAFDHPHFREDTDIGWRVQELGAIPFSREAWVYHPPQPRSIAREALSERSRFFEKDALLLRKHPQRCIELIRRECQWVNNPYYWTYFLKGLERYQVPLPKEIRALMPEKLRP